MSDTNNNTGDRNTGNCNTGNLNTAGYNTGNWNTAGYNTGDCNTGDCNTGNCNTRNCNTGDRNTGDCNTGYCNTGNWNTGDWNTGNWNTGDWNTGYCNSITPKDCLIFNKPSTRTSWNNARKPKWMHVSLTKWIDKSAMSDKEKEAYPSYVTTGGYLKSYTSLKHAYIEAWDKATQEDRDLTRQLPNFDETVFEEVFGFNPWKSTKKQVTLELTDEQLEKIKKILED